MERGLHIADVRAQYSAGSYGAFVLDPDENNVEAVCHAPADEEPMLS